MRTITPPTKQHVRAQVVVFGQILIVLVLQEVMRQNQYLQNHQQNNFMLLFAGGPVPNCADHSSHQTTCEGTSGCVWLDAEMTCASATLGGNETKSIS